MALLLRRQSCANIYNAENVYESHTYRGIYTPPSCWSMIGIGMHKYTAPPKGGNLSFEDLAVLAGESTTYPDLVSNPRARRSGKVDALVADLTELRRKEPFLHAVVFTLHNKVSFFYVLLTIFDLTPLLTYSEPLFFLSLCYFDKFY